MENQTPKKSSDREYVLLGLQIVGDFGATIAIPVVVLVLLAQLLERKYGHAPWITISAFVLAATISGRMIYEKAKEYGKRYQELDKNKNDQQ